MQCWLLGADPASVGPPESVIEGSLLYALQLVQRHLALGSGNGKRVDKVEVWAGNWLTSQGLLRRFNNGALQVTSAFA